ncbi:hypothetical protein ACFOEE_19995 [Pseudoalteromonas fenneropenaei]|uniref:Uncharacterized protein n=1 Tax=Pseudoalteromonas fenneropenaei TaxID=1737459 RepID=A0ABV7CQM6_9GAMM
MNYHPLTAIVMLAVFSFSCSALANADVTSREYKQLLDPAHFTYSSESLDVASYDNVIKTNISNAIGRNVNGSLSLNKNRQIAFYDSPSSCVLRANGYLFRERSYASSNEVTLKFRSSDRYISAFEDLSSVTNGAETKLEADIGLKNGDSYKVVYSHSTTAINTRTLSDFKDIHSHFPGFADDYGFSDNLPLAVVGGIYITEHVYKGTEIDLGSIDAELSLTLWYVGQPSAAQHPMLAEVSFKIEDGSAAYSQKVVQRAKLALEALQTLDNWNSIDNTSKTQRIYNAAGNFCQ